MIFKVLLHQVSDAAIYMSPKQLYVEKHLITEAAVKHSLLSLGQAIGSSVGQSMSMKMFECADVCKEQGHSVILLSTMFNSVNSFIN